MPVWYVVGTWENSFPGMYTVFHIIACIPTTLDAIADGKHNQWFYELSHKNNDRAQTLIVAREPANPFKAKAEGVYRYGAFMG